MDMHRGTAADLYQLHRAGGVLVFGIFGSRERGASEGDTRGSVYIFFLFLFSCAIVAIVVAVVVVAVVVAVIVAVVHVVISAVIDGAGGILGTGGVFTVGQAVLVFIALAGAIFRRQGADVEFATAELGNEGPGVERDGIAYGLSCSAATVSKENLYAVTVAVAVGSRSLDINPGDHGGALDIEGDGTFKGEDDGAYGTIQPFAIIVSAGGNT